MNIQKNNPEENFFLLCTENFDFMSTITEGAGWSTRQEEEGRRFEKNLKYTFIPTEIPLNAKTSKSGLYCEELGLTFKRVFIMRLYLSKVLVLKI